MMEDRRLSENRQAKLLVNVREAQVLTSLSRSTLYNLMQGGELLSIKVGSKRLIPLAEIHAFVERHLEASN